MSRFQISLAAERDISDITRYIARDNPVRALSFARELRAKMVIVGERPLSFPERSNWRPGLRVAVHRRYLIIFQIVEGIVEILRVLHGARDIESLLET